MADFLEALKEFLNALINGISNYVNSPLAFVVNSELATLLKETTDEVVIIIRDVLAIFGR